MNPLKGALRRKRDVSKAFSEACAALGAQIAGERDILFGIALCFECIQLLYDGQPELTRAYHDELLAMIKIGEENLKSATLMTQQGRHGKSAVERIQAYEVDALKGCANAAELRQRSKRLVEAYETLFPGRQRNQDLTHEEVLKLIDAAAL